MQVKDPQRGASFDPMNNLCWGPLGNSTVKYKSWTFLHEATVKRNLFPSSFTEKDKMIWLTRFIESFLRL